MFPGFVSAIRDMSASDYAVMYGFLFALTLYLVYFAYGAFKRYRFMNATATSRIRSAAQGHVELKGLGELMTEDNILSPFSGRRCIWFHCTIEKKKRRGQRTTWSSISDECSHHLFRIVDETGECIIDPDGAYVVPEIDITWYGGGPERRNHPPAKQKTLQLGIGNYRFRERLILPATQVYALGWFQTIHSEPVAENIAGQVEDLVRGWKLQPARHLADFDLDGNGIIQKDEWKAVRRMARSEVLARIREQKHEHNLLRKPADGRLPFILSAQSEDDLVGSKKFRAYASIGGAFVIFSTLVIMYSIRPPLPL